MITELSSITASTNPLIDAERCITELQRGRAIVLSGDQTHSTDIIPPLRVVQLVETLSVQELETLMATQECQLVLSRSRALALDLLVDSNAVCLELAPHTPVDTIQNWAGLTPNATASNNEQAATCLGGYPADAKKKSGLPKQAHTTNIHFAKAALNLAAHAHVLPAFIMYAIPAHPPGLLNVSTSAANGYSDQSGELITLSSASIPLAIAERVELTVFRERHGNAEHVAITVGEPDFSDVVTVRVHSSCFTGDILGSMKCDCGEQLQRAISSMAEGRGGVILYVSQEGRGIGLASKLLAYQLQGQGMDTIDANQHLGFGADERRYAAAAFMLNQMGLDNINLMTNNPLKIDALREHGVTVHGRVPSPATVNAHNARYLETKRERAGHYATSETSG